MFMTSFFSSTNHKQKFLNLEEMFAISWIYLAVPAVPHLLSDMLTYTKKRTDSSKTRQEAATMTLSQGKQGVKVLVH